VFFKFPLSCVQALSSRFLNANHAKRISSIFSTNAFFSDDAQASSINYTLLKSFRHTDHFDHTLITLQQELFYDALLKVFFAFNDNLGI
jgi:hypothetical protein